MSAEAPSPAPTPPRPPVAKPVVKTNRAQIIVFTLLTLLLSAVTVIGGRLWLRNSETLVFAVGDANGPEAKFAAKLATVLKNNSSRLRLKIAPNPDNAKALAQFDRRDASLAILRTDARVPPRARAIAILEHDVVLVLSPGGKKIKSLSELKKKRIAVVGDGESNVNSSAARSRSPTAPTRRSGYSRRRRTHLSTSCSPPALPPCSRSNMPRRS
ncbi:hypothetical protein QIH80_02160 [Bradyrhizobium elkanii]|nr:hypothetical protein QIH80_02160 [Bradyrhizobium elkanii]